MFHTAHANKSSVAWAADKVRSELQRIELDRPTHWPSGKVLKDTPGQQSTSMVTSMRLLLSFPISLALTLGVAQAYEPGPQINLTSMTSEYTKGNYPMAQYIGGQLLKQEPSNLAIHYLLGNCYVKFGQLDKAKAEYNFCARVGQGSHLGTTAQTALDQIGAIQAGRQDKSPQTPNAIGSATGSSIGSATESSAGSSAGSLVEPSTTASAGASRVTVQTVPAEAAGPPPDKVDIQTLEYKERLLKTGADLIAANKVKLQRQIETVQTNAETAVQDMDGQIPGGSNRMTAMAAYGQARERMQAEAAARIKQLEAENAAEEQRITAFYQAQADKITSQKGNLTSQAEVGHGDTRLVQKGSGLFVRNYINFHGEVPLPPPPPELKATAQKLNADLSAKKKTNHD